MEALAIQTVDSFSPARDHFGHLEERLKTGETRRMSHTDLESLIEKEGRDLLRQLLQSHLDLRA